MQQIRHILGVAYVEWLAITKDKFLSGVVFLAVFSYLIVFGFVYHTAILTDIPVAVLDLDRSYTSRDIIQKIDYDPRMSVTHYVQNSDELNYLLQAGIVQGVITIPADLEKEIKAGRPVKVAAEIDGSNLIYAFNLRKAIIDVNRTVGGEIMAKSLIGAGIERTKVEQILKSVDFVMEFRYNPNSNYVNFLYLGLIIIALQQTCLLGKGLTWAREREQNTWVHFARTPISNTAMFIGKSIPYYLILISNAGIVFVGAYLFLNLPMHGNIMLLWLAFAIFAAAIVGMGYWISSWCRDTTQATMIICLFNLPMFLSSGFSWPVASMAPVIHYLGYIFPATWLLHASRAITMKGCGFQDLIMDFAMLAAMAVFFFILGVYSTRRIKYQEVGGKKIKITKMPPQTQAMQQNM